MKKRIITICMLIVIMLMQVEVYAWTLDVYSEDGVYLGTSDNIQGCSELRDKSIYKDQVCSVVVKETGDIWKIGNELNVKIEPTTNELMKNEIEKQYAIINNGSAWNIKNSQTQQAIKQQTREEAIKKKKEKENRAGVKSNATIDTTKSQDNKKANIIYSGALKEKIEKGIIKIK